MASKITLRSSDGKLFEVDETVAMKLEIIKHMIELGIIKHTIEGDCADSGIPIVKVNSKILSKVLEYCQKHVEAGADAYELMSWDDEFVKVDQATLCRLMEAANYLNIKGLLRLMVRAVGDMIRGKPFNIHNDLIKNDWGWGSGWVLLFLTQLRGWVLQFLTQPRLLRLRLRRQLRCRLRRRPRPRPRRV